MLQVAHLIGLRSEIAVNLFVILMREHVPPGACSVLFCSVESASGIHYIVETHQSLNELHVCARTPRRGGPPGHPHSPQSPWRTAPPDVNPARTGSLGSRGQAALRFDPREGRTARARDVPDLGKHGVRVENTYMARFRVYKKVFESMTLYREWGAPLTTKPLIAKITTSN